MELPEKRITFEDDNLNSKEISNCVFFSKHGIFLHLYIFPQIECMGWSEEEKYKSHHISGSTKDFPILSAS